MLNQRAPELVFGAVQLGLEYGAANRTGKPSKRMALSLVNRAVEGGITQFDTARAYGDSEDRLGEALRAHQTVTAITKLSPLSELGENASRDEVRKAVDDSIARSLEALQRDRLPCVLLHRAQHRTQFGGAVWQRLREHVERGRIASLGVSVQSPAEALDALTCAEVRHIQLPFNLLDWRWREAGVIPVLTRRRDITVHVRSVLLQGLLATEDASLWPNIEGVDARDVIALLGRLAKEFERESRADLCLAYARGQAWIDGVVIGLETQAQLATNLRLGLRPPLSAVDCANLEAQIPRLPEMLLNPALWPKR